MRYDHKLIAGLIEPGSKIIDLGCGDGELLEYLQKEKDARVQGIELDEAAITKCVQKGLSVFHSDIDTGLKGYPDGTFDYAILNQSLQQIKNIDFVIDESLRVAKKVIIGFPNFAHISARLKLLAGRAPVTESLPYRWHDTPNLRFVSIADFREFLEEKNLKLIKEVYITEQHRVYFLPNLFAKNAIFVISK